MSIIIIIVQRGTKFITECFNLQCSIGLVYTEHIGGGVLLGLSRVSSRGSHPFLMPVNSTNCTCTHFSRRQHDGAYHEGSQSKTRHAQPTYRCEEDEGNPEVAISLRDLLKVCGGRSRVGRTQKRVERFPDKDADHREHGHPAVLQLGW